VSFPRIVVSIEAGDRPAAQMVFPIAAYSLTSDTVDQVRLRDIAEVRDGVDERRGLVRYDGQETLMLLVERRPDANTVRAAAEVRRVLTEFRDDLTAVQVAVVLDESVFIKSAIGGVTQAVLIGGLLAILVLLVFLRRRRALIAVAVAVPLSLALTLVIFDFFDVSFNLISLSGLALGVGMLVDNAIVVVENIARLRDEGMSPSEAGIEGVSEVAGAITASTLTTIAVFLPITFVEGLAGRLFLDQSLAVIGALSASLLVALTVVPLVASGTGPGTASGIGLLQRSGWIADRYERSLAWALGHRAVVLSGVAALLLVAGWVGSELPRVLVPRTDQGRVEMNITLPSGADLPLMSARSRDVERVVLSHPAVAHVLADLGERDEKRLQLDPRAIYEGEILVLLNEGYAARQADQELNQIVPANDVTLETRPVRTQLETLLAKDEADLQIDLVSERRSVGLPLLEPVIARLSAEAALTNVRMADDLKVPAYRIEFIRESMARRGVNTTELTASLSAAGRGVHATDLRSINEDVPSRFYCAATALPQSKSFSPSIFRRLPDLCHFRSLLRHVTWNCRRLSFDRARRRSYEFWPTSLRDRTLRLQRRPQHGLWGSLRPPKSAAGSVELRRLSERA